MSLTGPALERKQQMDRIEALLTRIADAMDALAGNAPTNAYGENLSHGIQNAHVRGMRGISTYGR